MSPIPPSHALEEPYDVIIVGGGITGLVAARELQATHRVLLLEAQPHLGGRCVSTEALGGAAFADHGAHYLGTAHTETMALLRELELERTLFDYVPGFGPDPIGLCNLDGRCINARRSQSYFEVQGLDATQPWLSQARMLSALASISMLCDLVHTHRPWDSPGAKTLDGMTFAELVEHFDVPPWFKDLMCSGVRGVVSQAPEYMSALYVLWYLRSNGGFSQVFNDQQGSPQQYGLRGGMGSLVRALAEQLRSSDVRTDTWIRRIEASAAPAGPVRVITRDGHTHRAHRVVVTATPRACRSIEFAPALSSKRRLLHDQRTGFAIKATAFYDHPWWRNSKTHQGQLFSVLNGRKHDGVDWAIDISHPRGDYYALVVFIKPDLVDQHESEGEAATRGAISRAIGHAMGDTGASDHLRELVWYDWRKHPSCPGGPNTNFGPHVLTTVREALWHPEYDGRLFFGGAEHATDFTGYVEGAVRSGRYLAERVRSPHTDAPPRGLTTDWSAALMKLPGALLAQGFAYGSRLSRSIARRRRNAALQRSAKERVPRAAP
ncbi:MAG: flavin monoamine oxidase family protein [Myxococcota bacterium]